MREVYSASAAKIMEADVAEESTSLVAANIKQRTAIAILAQANIIPALALKLLKK